jgi:hypothetical protein
MLPIFDRPGKQNIQYVGRTRDDEQFINASKVTVILFSSNVQGIPLDIRDGSHNIAKGLVSRDLL